MADASRSEEQVITDIMANASALAVMAEGWLPVETFHGNLSSANAVVIELSRLMNELRRARHVR